MGTQNGKAESVGSAEDSEADMMAAESHGPRLPGLDEKTHRLIDWNVEMLLIIMRQIVAHRGNKKRVYNDKKPGFSGVDVDETSTEKTMPLNEVREIIHLPEFDTETYKTWMDPDEVKIDQKVTEQLHHLVSTIASLYNPNPFHNFQHASRKCSFV